MMEPIKNFQDVRKYLAKIPNLHNGGCGISALAMYRWHKKNTKRMRVRIAVGYASQSDFQLNSRFLAKERGLRPVAPRHAGIIWADRETGQTMPIDARDFLDLAGFESMHIFRDEAPLLAMINRKYNWNQDFKRIYVARIAKRLDIDLSDVLV